MELGSPAHRRTGPGPGLDSPCAAGPSPTCPQPPREGARCETEPSRSGPPRAGERRPGCALPCAGCPGTEVPGYQPGRVPQVPVCPFSILSLSYIPSAPICCFSLARLRRTLFIDDTWKAKDRKGNGSAVARSPAATRATPASLRAAGGSTWAQVKASLSAGCPAPPSPRLAHCWWWWCKQTNKPRGRRGEKKSKGKKKKKPQNPTLQSRSDGFD